MSAGSRRARTVLATLAGALLLGASSARAGGTEAAIARAAREIRAGRWDRGARLLRAAEAGDPNPDQLRRVATLYEDMRDYCRAADAAERMRARAKGAAQASDWTLTADAAAYCGRRDEALAALAQATAAPGGKATFDMAAYLYLFLDEYRQSLAASDAFVALDPGDLWHWARRARAALAAGDRAAAEGALDRIAALLDAPAAKGGGLGDGNEFRRVEWILTWRPARAAPREAWTPAAESRLRALERRAVAREAAAAAGDPRALAHAAMLERSLGDEAGAAAVLDAFSGEDATDPAFLTELAKRRRRRGDLAGSRRALERAVARAGQDLDARRLIAAAVVNMRDCGATGTLAALIPPGEKDPGLLLARADADFQCGDFRGAAPVRADLGDCRARGAYEVLLSSDPANAEFATGLARAEEDCGDGDAARKTAGRALALAEGDRALLGRIAALLVRLKDCRGLSVARSLVAAEPGDAEALAGRGRAELTCGTRAAARADFRAAAAARPDDADLRRRLALLEQDAGAYDDELALLNGLLARAPGDAGLLEDRAVALSLSGEPEAAVAGFRAALNADPGRASAWASLAAVLGGLGRRDEALAAYDRALSLPSEDPGLRAAIAKGRAEAASFLTPERGHVSIGPWTPKPLLKRPPPP